MDFGIKAGAVEKQAGACVVVGIFETKKLTDAAKALDEASQKHISGILRQGDMQGAPNTSLLLHNVPNTACKRVLLVGLGKEKAFAEKDYLTALRTTCKALEQTNVADMSFYLADLTVKNKDVAWKVSQAALILQENDYRFEQHKSKPAESKTRLKKVTICLADRQQQEIARTALERSLAIAEGVSVAKDLGNTAPNVCTPTYLAKRATEMGKTLKLKVSVLEEKDMKKLGMGSLLAVAQGSHQPAKLITMEYRGQGKSEKPIVLVGKGITFDTGGISLKPPAAMDEMKYDMCGAASVFGTMTAIAQMKLPINVVGIIPTTENMPGGSATKPGDVVTSMSGQTIEILNTDAEGRLILCDALTYAEKFKPKAVIDIATLTGACVIALGNVATGLISNNEQLAQALMQAGEQSTDRAWQLPLWDDYQDLLKSNFADFANIGGRTAGTITAACFLSRFTEAYQWAHLDIAGTAWKSGAEKGATGRPVPLLTQYLIDCAEG